ncbi:hypothetical protein [Methanosphaerula subterraneus]|uniref:hypothetical protein n=1 Tax=Methanosphaerula subterraneus TaxID=3350244 RepID=UPI003F83C8B3
MARVLQHHMQSMTILLILILACLMMAAGCTSSNPQTTTTTSATTMAAAQSSAAAGTTPAAQAAAQSGTSGQAVDVKTLNALFPPAPAGWVIDQQPVGSTRLDQDNHAWTSSTASYTSTANKETTAAVTYQDTAGRPVGFKTIWSSFKDAETSDGYFKSTTVKGNPAWETHSIAGKTFGTWVSVNDRFMVYVNIQNGTKADYDAIINAIDFTGIAALK